jgi:hypothetical protein
MLAIIIIWASFIVEESAFQRIGTPHGYSWKLGRMDIYSIGVGLDDVAKDNLICGMRNPIYDNVYDSMLCQF